MCKNNWMHSNEEQKGRNETLLDFFIDSTWNEVPSGPCIIDFNFDVAVSHQIWRYLQPITMEGCEMMIPLLDLFDVDPDRRSPF